MQAPVQDPNAKIWPALPHNAESKCDWHIQNNQPRSLAIQIPFCPALPYQGGSVDSFRTEFFCKYTSISAGEPCEIFIKSSRDNFDFPFLLLVRFDSVTGTVWSAESRVAEEEDEAAAMVTWRGEGTGRTLLFGVIPTTIGPVFPQDRLSGRTVTLIFGFTNSTPIGTFRLPAPPSMSPGGGNGSGPRRGGLATNCCGGCCD